MKYSESETTEIKSFSESETTEIKKFSESEGTGIRLISLKMILVLLACFISNSVISSELFLFDKNNSGDVNGVLLANNTSYLVVGSIEKNFLNLEILEDYTKSSDDGTGDVDEDSEGSKSSDDGTGDADEDSEGTKSSDDGTGDVDEDSEGTKSSDDGTGDVDEDSEETKSSDDGTGNKLYSETRFSLSILLHCEISEGIIEDNKGNTIDVFNGKVSINNQNWFCHNENLVSKK